MRGIVWILAKITEVSDRMETNSFENTLIYCSGDCKSRRMADTPQEQVGHLGMVLGSSVNRILSAWNTSHLGWCLNPTRQNSCSMANTALQQAWNTKKPKKFQGEAKSFLCLRAMEPLERQEKITGGTCPAKPASSFPWDHSLQSGQNGLDF